MSGPRYTVIFCWYVLLVVFAVATCLAAAAYIALWRVPDTYVARATIVDVGEPPAPWRPAAPPLSHEQARKERNARLARMERDITGRLVIGRTIETVAQLGISVIGPKEILVNLTVQPVHTANILAVEYTSRDPREAEDVANVLVAEFVDVLREREYTQAQDRRARAEKPARRAEAELERATNARKSGAEVKAAEYAYFAALLKLDRAGIAVEEARVRGSIRVIDPARARQERGPVAWWVAFFAALGLNALLICCTLSFLAGRGFEVGRRWRASDTPN